jgi:hypothetical protein
MIAPTATQLGQTFWIGAVPQGGDLGPIHPIWLNWGRTNFS